MRVNMDSSIAADARFKLVAADLVVSWREVIGSCFLVWLNCYDRRSSSMTAQEIDVAAEMPGFADALLRRGLAHIDGDMVFVHGVEERIRFLEKQSEKGSRGGKKSGNSRRSRKNTDEAYASRVVEAKPEANASGVAQAYSPALSPAPALDPALDLDPKDKEKTALGLSVKAVTDHYASKYPKRTTQAHSPASKAKVRARLKDGYTAEQLKAAIDGNAASQFHVDGGHTSLELIMRDPAHVDRFLEKPGGTGKTQPRDPRVGHHPGSPPQDFVDGIVDLRKAVP